MLQTNTQRQITVGQQVRNGFERGYDETVAQSLVCRVLIVDEHAVIRTGIRAMLENTSDIEVVGEAETNYRIIDLTRELQPDIILMEVNMPRKYGIESILKEMDIFSTSKVILLNLYSDSGGLVEVMRAGASGFIGNRASESEFISGIKLVFSGGSLLPAISSQPLNYERRIPCLTPRESVVFQCICDGLSNKDMAVKLDFNVDSISYYISRIYRKLGVKSRIQAMKVGLDRGLLESSIERG